VGGLGRCYTLLPQHTLPLGGSKKALALWHHEMSGLWQMSPACSWSLW
jgi:hypothetical protein